MREEQPKSDLQQGGGHQPSQLISEGPPLDTPLAFPPLTLEMVASVLDFSPDALLVVDMTGTIVFLNAQMEALFGYGQEELLGQPVEVLLPEHLRTTHLTRRLRYLSAPRARPMGEGLHLLGQRKGGRTFPVDISLRPIQVQHTLYIVGAVRDMTAQRLGEMERMQLVERLQRQDQLMNLSHDAILVLDPTRHIISWNRGAEELYGWPESEVVGQAVSSLLATCYPQPFESILHHFERDGYWDGDLIHHCRDGREITVESRWVLMRNEVGKPTAILEINRDITARRRLEQLEQEARAEIHARLDLLQLILDRVPTGIFLVRGPQARLLLANRAAIELWGAMWQHDQPMEDFLTQQQVRLLSEDGQPLPLASSAAYHALTSGEPVLHAQLVIRRPDGISRPVVVDAIPLDLLQTFARLPSEIAQLLTPSERVVLVVHQDVTALKEVEALKDQFVSLATHELRTPVTVLAGYADLLLKRAAKNTGSALDEALKEKLLVMQEATQHLTRLTEDVMEATRIQAGQVRLQRNPTDLIALARKVVEQLQATTEQHQVSLQTTLAHLYARADGVRIEQVLANLLSNAIKYSPDGGAIEIAIWLNTTRDEACFSVRDYGMGIPVAQQAHLFGRFVRADNVRSTRIPGTGLGLYLCRELVEHHGGRIWFESQEHLGSTFFFTLPAEALASDERLP